MSFAENLREILDLKNIELKELAAHTGISKNTLDNYLSGQKSIPNAENAVKIAQYLETSVEYLVTGNLQSIPSKEYSKIITHLQKLNSKDYQSIKNIIESLAR